MAQCEEELNSILMKVKEESEKAGLKLNIQRMNGIQSHHFMANRWGDKTVTDFFWFQIRKGVSQGCILSPCIFNLYTEYIMRNAGLDDAQVRIKIAKRNINNLRYADDTTLMAESKEELKNLLMKVKEESEKADLKLNIQKTKVMVFRPITSWQTEGETMETVTDFILGGGLQNHCRW